MNGSAPSLQGSNITDRLESRGLTTASSTLKSLYDINGSVGGPIMRDRLWFFGVSRYFKNEFFLAGLFFPTDVTAVRRTDSPEQGYGGTYTVDNNARLTWAINDKQKLSGWYGYQYKVDPHWLINSSISPEAARVTRWHTQLSTLKWTYVASNHLLFEAGMAAGASPDTIRTETSRIGGSRSSNRVGAWQTPDVSRPDQLGLGRPFAVSVVQRIRQLRQRLAQRETRRRTATWALPAQRHQRVDRRHLVPDARLHAQPGHHPGAARRDGRTT